MIAEAELNDVADIFIGALCVWREAGGEQMPGKWGVANVIMHRVGHPGWWGDDVLSVVTHPYQFSSFNKNDPNSTKWPKEWDQSWRDSLRAFRDVYYKIVGDNVNGADCYYDKSLDNNPPAYSKDCQIQIVDNLRFYKLKP